MKLQSCNAGSKVDFFRHLNSHLQRSQQLILHEYPNPVLAVVTAKTGLISVQYLKNRDILDEQEINLKKIVLRCYTV